MRGPWLTVVLGTSALLLAACNGGDGDEDSGGDTEQTSGDDGPAAFDCQGATTLVPGHVVIETEADVAQLEGANAVEGELQIDKTNFTNLDFLGCIEQVGSHLTIFGNTELTNVDGLASLTYVGGDFIFSQNGATDLDGANALAQVGNSVIMLENDNMTGVSGLNSLASIGGAITIRSNPILEHIDGLRGLRSVGGQLAITQNPSLCISSINQVGAGITEPAVIPDNWSTRSNNDDC